MNCDEFATRWNAHVARIQEAGDETAMLEHSRACQTCGARWRQHDELSHLLASVIEPHKAPPNLASRLVDKLPPPSGQRPAPADRGQAPPPPLPQAGPLLLAAFAGGAVVYALTGVGGRRGGMGQVVEEMMYSELLGRMGTRGPFGAGFVGTMAGDFTSVLIAIVLLVWITRASFWQVLFPIRMPAWIAFARWMAIPAALVGGLRLLCALWIMFLGWINSMGTMIITDWSVWIGTTQLVDQIWSLCFWLTILALLFGVLNELTTRYAKPLQ